VPYMDTILQKCSSETNQSDLVLNCGYFVVMTATPTTYRYTVGKTTGVTLASNHTAVEPLQTARRRVKSMKAKEVPQPNVVHKYNKGMGGVDVLDRMLAAYRLRLRCRSLTLQRVVNKKACHWLHSTTHCRIITTRCRLHGTSTTAFHILCATCSFMLVLTVFVHTCVQTSYSMLLLWNPK